jgi:Short C-terminal domain
MMRRRRGPGLLMTAAVVGTAAHVGASSANKSAQAQANAQAQAQQSADQSQQIAELQAQQAAMAAPAAAPAVDPMMAELQNLASLHTSGILSDEEFAAAKAKLLGI